MDDPTIDFGSKKMEGKWQTLVHVCRRWRTVVFGSPRRLNLHLFCAPKTPARDLLDVWPALPLSVWGYNVQPTESVDNIAAVLEHSDRVRQIRLEGVLNSYLEVISAAMQVPFPELMHLVLLSGDETAPVFPDSFLDGSAPHLRSLALRSIPFPGLPRLLLSATNLAHLCLDDIPYSGYIPPEAMVAALSTLTGLQFLSLRFRFCLSRCDPPSRRPPSTRSVLPVLTHFYFIGYSEYLDGIVAAIDTPRLDRLSISFFFCFQIEFDTPQLIQFITRTPTFKAFKGVRLFFENYHARVILQAPGSGAELNVDILCRAVDWQSSSLGLVFAFCFPPFSTLEDLYISDCANLRSHSDNIENTSWLNLLRPFSSVMNLYLSRRVAPRIMHVLQELVGARTMQVLPTLQNILLEELQPSEPVKEGVERFVAARQVAGHPIAVSRWEDRGFFSHHV